MESENEWGKIVFLNPEVFEEMELEDKAVRKATASLLASDLQEAYRKICEEVNKPPESK